jgi:MFS-type transporter involved in bile tolerance (Atg22 family)
MTEPALASPPRNSRTHLVFTIFLFVLMFLLGNRVVDQHVSRRVFAGVVIVTGVISGVIPALGSRRPRLARWLVLASLTSLAVALGLLARNIIRGFHG